MRRCEFRLLQDYFVNLSLRHLPPHGEDLRVTEVEHCPLPLQPGLLSCESTEDGDSVQSVRETVLHPHHLGDGGQEVQQTRDLADCLSGLNSGRPLVKVLVRT